MKVCILTTSFPRFPGDYASVFVYDLAAELAAAGNEVRVVTPGEVGFPAFEEMGGIAVYRFTYFWPSTWQRIAYLGGIPDNLRRYPAAWLQLPFFLMAFLWKALRTCRDCEVVHAHWVFSGLIGLALAKFAPKPVVLTVHGSDLNVSSGNRLLRWLRRFVVLRVDRVIAVSKPLADKLRELGLPQERIVAIANGVDLDVFKERQKSGAFGYHLVWAGRMSPVKGLIYLFEALPSIVAAFPQTQVTLVGDGPLRPELEQLAKKLGLDEQIRFIGFANHAQVADYLQAADLFVLPSLSEGLPLVILEAMSSGLPVVATAVGGTDELVLTEPPGQTGILVTAEDVAALREAILFLFNHPDEARQMGRNGRLLVEENYTWTAVAQQTLALYQETLVGGREPS